MDRKLIEKTLERTFNVMNYFSGLILAVLVVAVMAQVIARYFFQFSFSWAEELPIFLFAWTAFLGMAVAFQKDEHLSVDIITNLLSFKQQKILKLICYILELIFFIFVTRYGIEFAYLLKNVSFTVIAVSKGLYYASLVVGSIMAVLTLAWKIISMLFNWRIPEMK